MSHKFQDTRRNTMMVTWLKRAYEVLSVTFEDNARKEALLKAAWIYYGRQLGGGQLGMFLEDLEGHSSQAVDAAIAVYQRRPNPSLANPRPPFPADIIGIIVPQPTDQEAATEIANEVFRMMQKVGRPGAPRVRALLSAVAYETAIESRGSWESLCASFNEPGLVGTVMAQLKATASSVLARHRRTALRETMAPYRQLTAASAAEAIAPARADAAGALPERQAQADAVVDVVEKLAQRRALV